MTGDYSSAYLASLSPASSSSGEQWVSCEAEKFTALQCAHTMQRCPVTPARDQVPGHTLHRINEWQQSPVSASLHHLLNTVQALVSTLFRCPHPVTTFKTPINLNKSF